MEKNKCHWSNTFPEKIGVPTSEISANYESEDFAVFAFPCFREASSIDTAQEFLSEYSEMIELTHPESESVKNTSYPANQQKCDNCILAQDCCTITENFVLKTEIDVKITTKWRNEHKKPGAPIKDVSNPIHLSDIRWNNQPVVLNLIRPSFVNETSSHRLDIPELRFFNFGVTTRLAKVIVTLHERCSIPLISEAYTVNERTIHRICAQWKKCCTKTPTFGHDYWITSDTLCGNDVQYIVDFTDGTLLNILTGSSAVNSDYPFNFFKLFSCESLLLDSNREITQHPLSFNDIYILLFETYTAYTGRLSLNPFFSISHGDLGRIFNEALDSIKKTCQDITTHSQSKFASYSSMLSYKDALWDQLKRLLLMSNTRTKKGEALFPELVKILQAILSDKILIDTFPRPHRNDDPTYFTANKLTTLRYFLQFKKAVHAAAEPEYNFQTMINRLSTFNEPATAVVSSNSNRPVQSVFETLQHHDFYQLYVPLRAPHLKCLTHLVKCGLLDTETPILDLPCVSERLRNGGRCQELHCPILEEPQ